MNSNLYYIDIENFIDNFMPQFMQGMDIEIQSGDLKTGDTNEQDMFLILKAAPGNFYYFPKLGYDINSKLSGTINKAEERKLVTEQLKSDGFSIKGINIITIDDYEKTNDTALRAMLLKQNVIYNIKAER